MKRLLILSVGLLVLAASDADAQRSGKGGAIGQSNPLPIGASGVAWYTTWETGLAEARRSNRPILFMSAATTCRGVSGVF